MFTCLIAFLIVPVAHRGVPISIRGLCNHCIGMVPDESIRLLGVLRAAPFSLTMRVRTTTTIRCRFAARTGMCTAAIAMSAWQGGLIGVRSGRCGSAAILMNRALFLTSSGGSSGSSTRLGSRFFRTATRISMGAGVSILILLIRLFLTSMLAIAMHGTITVTTPIAVRTAAACACRRIPPMSPPRSSIRARSI